MSVSRALDVLNMKPTTHNLDSKDLAHHVTIQISTQYLNYINSHCAGEQDDPGDRAEAGGVQPADEEQEQEEDLQVPEDPGDVGAGGAAGQVEIIQGGVLRV